MGTVCSCYNTDSKGKDEVIVDADDSIAPEPSAPIPNQPKGTKIVCSLRGYRDRKKASKGRSMTKRMTSHLESVNQAEEGLGPFAWDPNDGYSKDFGERIEFASEGVYHG
jgi:hypothetical protein